MSSGQGSCSSLLSAESIESHYQVNHRAAQKTFKQKNNILPCCSRCQQPFPSLEVEPCKHRFCGECIPQLVHQALGKKSLECPECQVDSPDALPVLIATAILGGFLLENYDLND
jgi:hypothetical protein